MTEIERDRDRQSYTDILTQRNRHTCIDRQRQRYIRPIDRQTNR